MLLLSYVRKHILLHIAAFAMYSSLFFIMLLVIGEIIYDNGYDRLSVEDTTYTFRIYTDDSSKVDSIVRSIDDYSDILVASEENDYVLVSFLTPISENRNIGMPITVVNKNEIAYLSTVYFYDNFIDIDSPNINYVVVGGKELEVVGQQNIQLCLPVDIVKIMCVSTEDFWDVAKSDSILLSVYKDERMSDSELEVLNRTFADNGITAVNYLPDRITSASKVINSDAVRLIYIIVILSCLCFARLTLMLVANRNEEYRIMRYCGASKMIIARHILNHVMFVFAVSALGGSILYWVIAAFSTDLFSYSDSAFAFYLLVLAGYLVAALVTSGLCILAKAAKDGY